MRDAVIDCVAAVRRRETELLTQLRAAFAGDPAVQAFVADRPSIEATLQGLENTCQLTDIIVKERSVELLLLKDDIAQRMTSLLEASLAQPPPHMRTSYIQFIPTPCNQAFPVGRLDFVDDAVSSCDEKTSSSADAVDRGERPQGDGHDSVPDGAADTDDQVKDGGLRPEVEIKRRKVDSNKDEQDEELSGELTTRRPIRTSDRETMTSSSRVQSASTTMNRCVHVEDKLVATSSQLSVDRSNETDPESDSSSVKCTSQTSQTSASMFHMRSKYVETEPPAVANKAVSTERPFQLDKVDHV